MINSIDKFSPAFGSFKGYNSISFGEIQKQRQAQKQQFINEQYNDIFEHEQAHKRVAGELGGPIVIEKNSQGVPVSGHVDIKMPVLDKSNPDKTIKHADTVIKSAMAPDDPSNQDYKVAAEAKQVKSQAVHQKHNQQNQSSEDNMTPGKSLNLIA